MPLRTSRTGSAVSATKINHKIKMMGLKKQQTLFKFSSRHLQFQAVIGEIKSNHFLNSFGIHAVPNCSFVCYAYQRTIVSTDYNEFCMLLPIRSLIHSSLQKIRAFNINLKCSSILDSINVELKKLFKKFCWQSATIEACVLSSPYYNQL